MEIQKRHSTLTPPSPHQQAHRHVYKDPGFLALEPRGSQSDRGCEPEGTPETAPSLGVRTPVLVGGRRNSQFAKTLWAAGDSSSA